MKKVVINACYGGFGLSAKAIRRYAELIGKPCYFFKCLDLVNNIYEQILDEQVDESFCVSAFSIEDPTTFLKRPRSWNKMSLDEKEEENKKYKNIEIITREVERDDPNLVRVVEELGEAASGQLSKLKIVEIPDDIEWIIEEYDGSEHIAEAHNTWC